MYLINPDVFSETPVSDLEVSVKAPRPHGHSARRGATLKRRRPHGGVRMEDTNEKGHLSPVCMKWAAADLRPHAESREDNEPGVGEQSEALSALAQTGLAAAGIEMER